MLFQGGVDVDWCANEQRPSAPGSANRLIYVTLRMSQQPAADADLALLLLKSDY